MGMIHENHRLLQSHPVGIRGQQMHLAAGRMTAVGSGLKTDFDSQQPAQQHFSKKPYLPLDRMN